MKIPKGYFGLISGRSSVAFKGVMTHVGIIDSDFYGVGKVIHTNISQKPFDIKCGDRVGQTRWDKIAQNTDSNKTLRNLKLKHYFAYCQLNEENCWSGVIDEHTLFI